MLARSTDGEELPGIRDGQLKMAQEGPDPQEGTVQVGHEVDSRLRYRIDNLLLPRKEPACIEDIDCTRVTVGGCRPVPRIDRLGRAGGQRMTEQPGERRR